MPISDALQRAVSHVATHGATPPPSNVVSMAVLFQVVKRQRTAQMQAAQRAEASISAGEAEFAREQAAREANLDRMRQQTKSQLAVGMGMSPVLMGGGLGPADPTTAAFISQSARKGTF